MEETNAIFILASFEDEIYSSFLDNICFVKLGPFFDTVRPFLDQCYFFNECYFDQCVSKMMLNWFAVESFFIEINLITGFQFQSDTS